MHDVSIWVPTLNCLRGQRRYLEGLLSKTATTLNALRDRQTRNERALSANPTPRSKRKKILQNKWRTSKTMQTCENEERAILECLGVCKNNISTLEAIVGPEYCSSPTNYHSAAEYNSTNSYANTGASGFDWKDWGDETPVSLFQRCRERSLVMEEIAPEVTPNVVLRVPPNMAPPQLAHTMLSPQAAVFEPRVVPIPLVDEEMPRELDKLSISGLLSSKHMRLISKRHFSDDAIGHVQRSTCEAPRYQPELEEKARAPRKRTRSM
ncbi:hypothetical protein CC80DRAFT_505132 [Byssothecium circinans]|uniref:Uncharacterized protein n=1 Tax=Byssothecium circinans TaxID=147558 RepID=A0A6A5TTR5_9PLEO|nr:hypothetical protein CC80DRAFT_505132 [Byssothecium circinans]